MSFVHMRRLAVLALIVALALAGTAATGGADTAASSAPKLPGSIAYSAGSQHNGVPYQVYVAQPDGSITQLTHGAGSATLAWPGPAWSPDGSRLLVRRDDGTYVIPADGSSERRVFDPSDAAKWSTDGGTIAFQVKSALYVVDPNGSAQPRLLTGRVNDSFGSAWSWSPDEKQIVYAGTDAKKRSALFLVNTTGAQRPRKIAIRPRPSNPRGARVYHTPSYRAAMWSPDGSRIAFQWDDGRAKCCQNDWIYVMRPNGSGVTRVHRGNIRAWSPDGQSIAFAEGLLNDWSLSVVKADGTDLRRLQCRQKCGDPTWFPDGTRLAYANRDGEELDVVRSDGSGRRIIARPGWLSGGFSLSPTGSTIAYLAGKGGDWNRYLYVVGAGGWGRRLVAHSSTLRFSSPSWRPTHTSSRSATNKGASHG